MTSKLRHIKINTYSGEDPALRLLSSLPVSSAESLDNNLESFKIKDKSRVGRIDDEMKQVIVNNIRIP